MPLEHLNVVFGEISRSTAHFLIGLFVLILRHMSCLYILETNPLSVTYFANIFSHIELSFCFAYGLFAVQKLLSIIRSHLSIFGFISFILGDGSIKIFLQFMSKSVLPVFSSKCFIISSFTFRSISSWIHFEFIFMYVVRECSNLIFLYVAVQFSQHHLLTRLFFLHCIVLLPLSQINWP